MNVVKETRNSKNVIFSFIQHSDAWKLSTKNTVDQFYLRNLNEILRIHKRYAKVIDADYYFFHGNIVKYVKRKIPNLKNFRLFIQYYDLARYLFMSELCKEYDKVLYIDTDIIPITRDTLFDEMDSEDAVYLHKIPLFDGPNCPFYKEMKTYNKILKDKTYKYNGHTNHGVLGGTGDGPASFIRNHADKIIQFTKKIDDTFEEELVVYIGIEHYYMYMMGTAGVDFNLKYFKGQGWNCYVLNNEFPKLSSLKNMKSYRFLHFCGGEAKKFFEKKKKAIRNLVKHKIGDYNGAFKTWREQKKI